MRKTIRNIADKICRHCCVQYIDKDKCKVHLEGAPSERVIVDMDCKELKLPSEQKRCDYLFFGGECGVIIVAPIELKGGKVESLSAVVEQLEGGAKLASELLPRNLPRDISIRFTPILVRKRNKKFSKLKKRRDITHSPLIVFRKKKIRIEHIHCGDSLTNAF